MPSFAGWLEGVDRAIQALTTAHLRPPDSSRILGYRTRLASLLQDRVYWAEDMYSTFPELAQLIPAYLQLAPEPAWHRKIRQTYGDARTTPAPENRANSLARDTQFELYIAASLKNAGHIVAPGRADVVVRDRCGSVVIEAKRIKTTADNGLLAHIRKAANQIAAERAPGVIALDVTQRLQLQVQHYDDAPCAEAALREAIAAELARPASPIRDEIADLRDHVLGVLVMGMTTFGYLAEGEASGVQVYFHAKHATAPTHSGRRRFERLIAGLPGGTPEAWGVDPPG